jgi:hypothetical protein
MIFWIRGENKLQSNVGFRTHHIFFEGIQVLFIFQTRMGSLEWKNTDMQGNQEREKIAHFLSGENGLKRSSLEKLRH